MKLTLSLSNLITKASRVVTRHYQREVAQYNITPSQGGVVHILNIIGPSTQVEIAKILHLEKTNINAMIKKLEAAGLLAVEKDTDDTRKSKVVLTKKGCTLAENLNEVDAKVGAIYRELAGNEKNAAIIREFLEKIVFGGLL